MKKANKQDILNTVSIVDVAEEAGISLEKCSSGNFDLRCKCPSANHKSGSERTASLYIDSSNNNFYCYGCAASSNVIDFYMVVNNVEFAQAFAELRKIAIPSGSNKSFIANASNFIIIAELSVYFREQMNLHKDDLKWISYMMKKTDEYIELIDSSDLASARRLTESIKGEFEKRYNK
jgi:DNA primase